MGRMCSMNGVISTCSMNSLERTANFIFIIFVIANIITTKMRKRNLASLITIAGTEKDAKVGQRLLRVDVLGLTSPLTTLNIIRRLFTHMSVASTKRQFRRNKIDNFCLQRQKQPLGHITRHFGGTSTSTMQSSPESTKYANVGLHQNF